MSDYFEITTVHINSTKGYVYSEFSEEVDPLLLTDDGKPDMGCIYRMAQREYGRCIGKAYVDAFSNGPKVTNHIGWVFVSREQYDDCADTFLRETWVTIAKVTPAYLSYQF